MELFDCLRKLGQKIQGKHRFEFYESNDIRYFNLKNDKNKNITVIQYTMVHF